MSDTENDDASVSDVGDDDVDVYLRHVIAFINKVEWEGSEYYWKSYRDTSMCWNCFEMAYRWAQGSVEDDQDMNMYGELDEGEEYCWRMAKNDYGDSMCENRDKCARLGEKDREYARNEDRESGSDSCSEDDDE
jgi:hypothetical protein